MSILQFKYLILCSLDIYLLNKYLLIKFLYVLGTEGYTWYPPHPPTPAKKKKRLNPCLHGPYTGGDSTLVHIYINRS